MVLATCETCGQYVTIFWNRPLYSYFYYNVVDLRLYDGREVCKLPGQFVVDALVIPCIVILRVKVMSFGRASIMLLNQNYPWCSSSRLVLLLYNPDWNILQFWQHERMKFLWQWGLLCTTSILAGLWKKMSKYAGNGKLLIYFNAVKNV